MSDIEKLIQEMITKINELNERVQRMEASCKNMDRHIQFVETTYDNLCNSKPLIIASKMGSFFKSDKTLENSKQ